MPPVLLIHGTNERLWTQGQSMSRVLTDRGVPHELIPLEGAPHGLENWEGHAPGCTTKPVSSPGSVTTFAQMFPSGNKSG